MMDRYLFSAILDARAIIPSLSATTKDRALSEVSRVFASIGWDTPERLGSLFIGRERQASTSVCEGIAIPHIKWEGPFTAGLAFSHAGIEFGALDGKPVHILFLLAAPRGRAGEHLKVMARISRLARDEERMARLLKESNDTAAIMGIIKHLEDGL